MLERAFQRAQTLSVIRWSEVGEILLALAKQVQSSLQLTPMQQEEVRRHLARVDANVPGEAMSAFFRNLAG